MFRSNDYTHEVKFRSIYDRTDYIVNYDHTIPYALARGLVISSITEGERRSGLPQNDSRPYVTPLVLSRNKLPKSPTS